MRDSRAWLIALVLFVLALAAFYPVLANGWVDWDDNANFLDNPSFHGLDADSWRWAWTTGHLGVYQPLSWLLLLGQRSLWGMEPAGYHAVSLLLHAFNTVVFYFLTLTLLRRWRPEWDAERGCSLRLGAGLAVGLFAVHPLRTEVVAWVSCQPYLPCILCCQLSVLAYLHSQANQSRGWGWASLGLFTAALLFKAAALPLPALLLLLDVYVLRRCPGRSMFWSALKEKWLHCALAMVFLCIAVHFRTLHPPAAQDSFLARLVVAGNSIGFYWIRTLVPAELSMLYPVPSAGDLRAILVSGAVLLASVLAFALRRRIPGAWLVGLSYLILLAPNLGLVRLGLSVTADRYSYLATMGCCVGLAGLLAGSRWLLRPGLGGIVVASVVFCSVLSWRQCRAWHDSEALWTHAVAGAARDSAEANAALGNLLVRQHRTAEGIAWLERAVELKPGLVPANKGLGCALVQQGDFIAAVPHLVEALCGEPDDPESLRVLAVALVRLGQHKGAVACLAKAVRLDPDSAEAQRNLGLVRFQQGDLAGAEGPLAEGLRLGSGHAEAYHALGVICARTGRPELALQHWSAALRLRPDLTDAHNRAGLVLLERGRSAEALDHFARTLRLRPADVDALNGMGMVLALGGKLNEAVERFQEALEHDPDHADVRHNLGSALARLGRWQEAADAFAEVLRRHPAHEPARCNLERVRHQLTASGRGG